MNLCSFKLAVCWFIFPFALLGQGKLMLVGGGSETEGGWSDTPYGWAVENSINKKVAVISYSVEDDFIPNYFISLGALVASNIKIDSRAVADLQQTYDQLMQYDVFFFKGGDQSIYYTYFKGTKTQQAIHDKFQSGGVIAGTSAGMAILSGVIFTAESGSVYPDESLRNFRQNKIKLKDDFLSIFPTYLFDSHFTERGRIGRLLPFMARWFIDRGELLTGIGVDDRTSLCIGSDKVASVFGTGSVSIYETNNMAFGDYLSKPLADSVHVVQLLHGHSYDLANRAIVAGPNDELITNEETGNYTVIVSGSEGISTNTSFLNYLINNTGNPQDTIVVVTAPGGASTFIQKLSSLGIFYWLVETNISANDDSQFELRNSIRRSRKVLFVENDDNKLFDFLEEGGTGQLLRTHIVRNNMVTAFVGEDSRYAGKEFTTNHQSDQYAAYYGRLKFKKGLGLLQSSIIMSNTYDASTTDFYENTTAGVTYAMMADTARFGIYLNRNSYAVCAPIDGRIFWKASGDLSTLIIVNQGTTYSFAEQQVNSSGQSRQYVGFSSAHYALLNGNELLFAGTSQPSVDETYKFETTIVGLGADFSNNTFNLFPNPSPSGIFHVEMEESQKISFRVIDEWGRIITRSGGNSSQITNDLSEYPDGLYFLIFYMKNYTFQRKIMKLRTLNQVR